MSMDREERIICDYQAEVCDYVRQEAVSCAGNDVEPYLDKRGCKRFDEQGDSYLTEPTAKYRKHWYPFSNLAELAAKVRYDGEYRLFQQGLSASVHASPRALKPRAWPRWHVGFTDHLEVRHSLAATTDKTASKQFGRNIHGIPELMARLAARHWVPNLLDALPVLFGKPKTLNRVPDGLTLGL